MSALWDSRRAMVAPAVGLCSCGVLTTEKDRSGRYGHRACIDQVMATVAREAHPYDDCAGVGPWLREQEQRAAELAALDRGRGWSA